MKVLELNAGSRSIGKECDKRGWECFSTDLYAFERIDMSIDMLLLMKHDIPFEPDIIWASPPCTTYSIAAISHHRKGVIAVSEAAKNGDRLTKKVLEIISWYPDALYFIENPVGMMRKMPFMKGMDRATVNYCKYGDTRMKPTDIWSNHLYSIYNPDGWRPRPKCWNGNKKCHHEAAPRGSSTGTQGLKNDYERSKIPQQLVAEILDSCITIESVSRLNKAS